MEQQGLAMILTKEEIDLIKKWSMEKRNTRTIKLGVAVRTVWDEDGHNESEVMIFGLGLRRGDPVEVNLTPEELQQIKELGETRDALEEGYKELIEAIRRLNLGGDPEERAKEILKERDLYEAIKYYKECAATGGEDGVKH